MAFGADGGKHVSAVGLRPREGVIASPSISFTGGTYGTNAAGM